MILEIDGTQHTAVPVNSEPFGFWEFINFSFYIGTMLFVRGMKLGGWWLGMVPAKSVVQSCVGLKRLRVHCLHGLEEGCLTVHRCGRRELALCGGPSLGRYGNA